MKIAAIVLAAGESKRYGQKNKLLSSYKGTRLIDHCLNTVLSSPFYDRILVTGHDHLTIAPIVKQLPIRMVHNPEFAKGMGTSLAAGAGALRPDCEAFMVFLADMPCIESAQVDKLIAAYTSHSTTHSIFRPVYRNKPGHPVLFSVKHARDMTGLIGDRGAADLIAHNTEITCNIPSNSAVSIFDIDN